MAGGVLLALVLSAHAGDPGACLASTTVLEDHLAITLGRDGRLERRRRWTVRLDDPLACAEGLPAPEELDGARDRDAIVRGDRLQIPTHVQPGATFTLTRVGAAVGPRASGWYRGVPGLAVEQAEVVLELSGAPRLAVATDDHAQMAEADARSRKVRVTWPPLDTAQARRAPVHQVAWATWRTWDEATDALAREVDRRVARRNQLGPAFREELDLAPYAALPADRQLVAALVEEASRQVRVAPGARGRFEWSRSAIDVANSGEGTAAERALVLLSTLRSAGLDARPALVRPATDGAIPGSLPAPEAYTMPAVVVRGSDGRTDAFGESSPTGDATWWIDPAAPPGDPAIVPSAFRGGQVVATGDLPHLLDDRVAPDGLVHVHTELRLDEAGDAILVARVRAEDAAIPALRAWLAPRTPVQRQRAWADVIRVARPGIGAVQVSASGIDDPSRPPDIRVMARIPGALDAVDGGLIGRVPPLVGPALAAALAPNVEVREAVVVQAPPGHAVVLATRVEDLHDDHVLVLRAALPDGATARLETDALLPQRHLSGLLEVDARARLRDQARLGPVVAVLPEGKRSARLLSALTEITGEDRVVVSAALDPSSAERGLRKAVERGQLAEVLEALGRVTPTGAAEPFRALFAAVPEDQRFEVLDAMERHGLSRDAWQLAGLLTRSEDPDVAVQGLVAVARLQGRQPDAIKDAAGRAAWIEPLKLLNTAHKRSMELPGATAQGHPSVLVPLAAQLLLAGKADEARPLLDAALQHADTPEARAVRLYAQALAGEAGIDELGDLAASHADDAAVLGWLARAALTLGQPLRGRDLALAAARARHHDAERWMLATDAALAAGDLPTALYAARRANDRDPVAQDTGVPLQILATLAGNAEVARLATERSGYQALIDPLPAPFATTWTVAQPAHELAMMRLVDAPVVRDPEFLAKRAELLLAAGRVDEAARDGWLLGRQHGRRAELTRVHSAYARLWSSDPVSQLDPVAWEPTGRAARMEWALLSGARNPMVDAGALGTKHVGARVVLMTARDPAGLLAESGWTADDAGPVEPPDGFTANRLLSVRGVSAWSDPVRAAALLVTAPDMPLPPPLSLLLTPGPILDTTGDVQIRRYEGEGAPVYVAVDDGDDARRYGVGYSPAAARQAALAGRPPQTDEAAGTGADPSTTGR